jgi:hypothetical protein
MKSLLKSVASMILGVVFGIFLITLFLLHPQPDSPHSYEVTSKHYDINQKQAAKRSIGSAVRVVSLDTIEGNVSALSGTYFTFKDKFYILTSAHGIISPCNTLMVFHLKESTQCKRIVVMDTKADYAIFEIEELKDRKPIKLPNALANWKKSYNILDKTYYTGYPNSIGPTTWTGASGSGMFDEKGELIGIIMALDVGMNEYGYQVLNNFVIVVPVWQIDFGSLME